jgi:hypothetical protein
MLKNSSKRMRSVGFSAPVGCHSGLAASGKHSRQSIIKPMCRKLWRFGESMLMLKWEYEYPSKSRTWKNNIQIVQTDADPPNQGKIIFPIIGCT